MNATEELQYELREAYQDEVASAFNYQSHAKRLEGIFGEIVADSLEADVSDELEHAQEIARVLDEVFDIIVLKSADMSLDRQPYFNIGSGYESGEDAVIEVLTAVVNAEEDAVSRYERIAELAREAGYPDVEQFAARLLAEERSHLDETRSKLEEFR